MRASFGGKRGRGRAAVALTQDVQRVWTAELVSRLCSDGGAPVVSLSRTTKLVDDKAKRMEVRLGYSWGTLVPLANVGDASAIMRRLGPYVATTQRQKTFDPASQNHMPITVAAVVLYSDEQTHEMLAALLEEHHVEVPVLRRVDDEWTTA